MTASAIQTSRAAEPIPLGGPIEKLSPTHRALAVAVRDGRTAPPGSVAREFLGVVRSANQNLDPPLSMRDLPIEVVQVILDNRAKTMDEFFRSWAESIAKNAAADRQASARSERDQAEVKRGDEARRTVTIFAAALNRACNTNKLSYVQRGVLAKIAGLAQLSDSGLRPAAPEAQTNRWSPAPPPPQQR